MSIENINYPSVESTENNNIPRSFKDRHNIVMWESPDETTERISQEITNDLAKIFWLPQDKIAQLNEKSNDSIDSLENEQEVDQTTLALANIFGKQKEMLELTKG